MSPNTRAFAGDARRVFPLRHEFLAAFPHALLGEACQRIAPPRVIRARRNAVVAAHAALRVDLHLARFRIPVIRAEWARLDAGRVRALLALAHDLERTAVPVHHDLLNVSRHYAAVDRLSGCHHIAVIRLRTGIHAGRASNAARRVKEMRELLLRFHFSHFFALL